MGQLAEYFLKVRVDHTQVAKDTARGVTEGTKAAGPAVAKAGHESGRKFGESMKASAGPILATLTLAGGIELFKHIIESGAEAVKTTRLISATIKSTGSAAHVTTAQVNNLSMAISNKTGKDDDAIASGAAMLLTFTNIRNETGKGNKIFDRAALTVTNMASAMSGGNVTAENLRKQSIQLGKALNDPVKGMTALTRVGVTFTDQQKAQVAAMVASGDRLGAQKLILKELGKEFGGAAAATSNGLDRLKVRIDNIGQDLGAKLIPAINRAASALLTGFTTVGPKISRFLAPLFDKFVKVIRTSVIPAVQTLWRVFAPVVAIVAKLALGMGVLAVVIGVKVLGALRPLADLLLRHKVVVRALALGILTLVAGMKLWALWTWTVAKATKIMAAAQAAMNVVMDANPIGVVVIALAALAAGLIYAYKHSATFRRIVDDTFRWIKSHWPLLVAILGGPIGAVVVLIIKHWKQITSATQAAWAKVRQLSHDLVQWLWNDFGAKIRTFFVVTIPRWFGQFIGFMHRYLIDPVRSGLSQLRQWVVVDFADKIIHVFTVTIPAAFHRGATLLGNAWAAIKNAVKAPVNWVIQHVINNGLIGAFDWISGKVGGPHINKLPGLAKGARIPGYGGGDRHHIMVEGGETVVDKVRSRMFAPLFAAAGIPGYQAGGKVPLKSSGKGLSSGNPVSGIFRGIGSVFGKLFDAGKILAAISTGNSPALTNAFAHLIPHGTGGAVANMASLLADIPKTLVKDAVHFLVSKFSGNGSVGGGSGSAVAQYAKKFATGLGHPYVTGGASPGGWDCSGFSAWCYEKFGYFPEPQGTRHGTSETQFADPLLQRSGAVPGALVFFNDGVYANPGHVGIALNSSSYVGADSHQVGTMISSLANNVGFRIPKGGFRAPGGSGSKAVGAVQQFAKTLMASHGWGPSQFGPLKSLWNGESGWRWNAQNPYSPAYGIPQSLPGSKMASAGADWRTNPDTQIRWGESYIAARYGTPANAWRQWQARNPHWYDDGGLITEPIMGVGLSGKAYGFGGHGPERVTPGAGMGDESLRVLGRIASLLEAIPAMIGASVAHHLNGVAGQSARRAYYAAG